MITSRFVHSIVVSSGFKNWIMIDRNEASQIIFTSSSSAIRRRLLSNDGGFEESLLADNLERECIEETCIFEEAREIFEIDLTGLDNWWEKLSLVFISTNQIAPLWLIIYEAAWKPI